MNTTDSDMTTPVPDGMIVVSKDEFFSALKADRRDIMPTTEARECTPWRVMATRSIWGWSSVGYASKFGAPQVYAISKTVGSTT